MQVDDLGLNIDTLGVQYFLFLSLNQTLSLVAICWTISPYTVNNISIIILVIKKKTLLDDQETHT